VHRLHWVRPGHPFFTEQLDRQREAQRIILAGIQERTLEAVAGRPLMAATVGDPSFGANTRTADEIVRPATPSPLY
jgi:hypothetical protein